jgi:hypothetical protein
MSNIYCSNCGNKHLLGSKFCTNCGNSLGGFANVNKQTSQNKSSIRKNVINTISDEDEDGIPTSFRKPSKLHYEIEKPNNKYSAKDLFNALPISDSEKTPRRILNSRKLTKEEFLAQSLKECSSRGIQDIDES